MGGGNGNPLLPCLHIDLAQGFNTAILFHVNTINVIREPCQTPIFRSARIAGFNPRAESDSSLFLCVNRKPCFTHITFLLPLVILRSCWTYIFLFCINTITVVLFAVFDPAWGFRPRAESICKCGNIFQSKDSMKTTAIILINISLVRSRSNLIPYINGQFILGIKICVKEAI